MFCPKCGKELREYERSCPYCGAAAAHGRGNRHRIKPMELIAIAAGVLALLLACTVLVYQLAQRKKDAQMRTLTVGSPAAAAVAPAEPLARPQFLRFTAADAQTAAAVPDYSVSGDLHEITNLEWMEWNGLSDTAKAILAQNLFVVEPDFYSEFFGRYEWNRYLQIPNFVTVDSMMHTYHLYFSLLLNRTEKQQLAAQLQTLSRDMLRASAAQLDALTGTAWENAAKHSTVYFAVGAALQDPKIQVPEQVKDVAAQELSAIYAAEDIAPCAVTEDLLDYSQFKPRGYYEGDETLETYFRAMMWYGQINFTQKKEDMNRTALLITLALHDTASDSWEKLYAVTSFFAGASDDLGYYEYLPAIEAAYGTIPDTELLRADETAYQHYTEQIRTLAAPQINSIPVVDPEGTVDLAQAGKGFRFMGQRFTLDAAVMQQLVFNKVGENAQGERRMLPDVLDMPAALGSETALAILTQQGDTAYARYPEQMQMLRKAVKEAPEELWSASLYAGWLYTLNPLLEEKGAGYPSFMTTEQWKKKALETYAGSFTELKHDTVLYAKQVMAEMGGGPPEELDDRGYVEPETEVYRRFAELAEQTADGLQTYGILDPADRENLTRLASLARSLETISRKELQNERQELLYRYTAVKDWYELVREAELVSQRKEHDVTIKYVNSTVYCSKEQDFSYNYMESIINIPWVNYLESIHNEITGPVILNFPSFREKRDGTCRRARIMQMPLRPLVKDAELKTLGGTMMASVYHVGSLDTIGREYGKIEEWASRKGYVCGEESFERYVVDYWTTRVPSEFVTEILVPVTRMEECR